MIPCALAVGTKGWEVTETWLMADPGLLQYIFALGLLCCRVRVKGETFRQVEMEGEQVAEDGLH